MITYFASCRFCEHLVADLISNCLVQTLSTDNISNGIVSGLEGSSTRCVGLEMLQNSYIDELVRSLHAGDVIQGPEAGDLARIAILAALLQSGHMPPDPPQPAEDKRNQSEQVVSPRV